MQEVGTTLVDATELQDLMKQKLMKAGLKEEHAEETARHLTYADACGIHSHGTVRMAYYAERVAKGGVNRDPQISFEETSASTGIVHCDNGMGQYVCNIALDYAIGMAKKSGVAVVGAEKTGHSGMLSYYVKKAAENNLIAIAMCQSDPMVVPFGGSENYFGTNPLAFSAPKADGEPLVFDMATTVQAWGKVLDARSKHRSIPDTWAVDGEGNPTTNPSDVRGLLPIAGPKGYGLMMMIDVLSGTLMGLPFGKHVSSMYADLTKKRNLGQLYILIDPKKFTQLDAFKNQISQMVEELHEMPPAKGFDQVYLPGERSQIRYKEAMKNGIEVASDIYDYLRSDTVHFDKYNGKDTFAE
ncbi:ureidoglycolate dehydrogenase [Lentilactobacillus hilgardii]|uniref:ureidoglycolate dehydrogenase n=1 Tax=Lentilactobacillus hilgardii TaxID=1588 RepID=UPI003FA5FA90